MGYRRALLFRWSARDRLAILVVALSVAFLVGTALVVLAAGSQTAAIAAEFETAGHATMYETAEAAEAATSPDALVLPYADVTTAGGTATVVVARPQQSPVATALGLAGEGTTIGLPDGTGRVTLHGSSGQGSVEATHRAGQSVLPPSWYLAPEETVHRLGTDGAIAISPTSGATGLGTPLQAALLFFLLGTREALTALSVAGVGAGVLVGVTVFGVTRLGVRDRLQTIRIVRSTGATPRTVLGLFALRAGLLTAVGTALGYALGVILPNAAVSVAIATGQPISLPLTMDSRTVRVLVPFLLVPIAVGTVAGAVAAFPAATRPPGRIDDTHSPVNHTHAADFHSLLRPQLLERRLVVPTAATLAAFVVLATVAAGLGTALGPMAAADRQTVVEPNAPHPIASQVPEAYADALNDRGIAASGEILLLEVVDGRPFVAVGAEYPAYAAVHGAKLVDGRAPKSPGEAVIGPSVAKTLGVQVGDRLVLGGSTEQGFTLVTIVGRFDASGATASQLVVPLDVARHLSGVPPGMVHIVSADRLPRAEAPEGGAVGVVDVAVPDRVAANTTATIRITLRNDGLQPSSHRVELVSGSERVRSVIDVPPLRTRTVTIELPVGAPGRQSVRVNDVRRTIDIVDPSAITIAELPAESPPDGQPQLRVETVAGEPVSNAAVSVDNRTWRTDSQGLARVEFSDTGEVRVVARAGNRSAEQPIRVTADAERRLAVRMTVRPSNPSVFVEPTVRIRLRNPWAVSLNRTLTLDGPTQLQLGPQTVPPGETATLDVPLGRQAAGTYELTLRAEGDLLAETTYRVTGDDRLAAALASSGRDGGSGLSQAIEAALGNLQLVLAVVVGLAGLMTVGATAATFAAGVQARRQTLGIHRATGADPLQVMRVVLGDAGKLGTAATAIGLPVGLLAVYGFAELGVLTVLGVGVPPVPPAPVLFGITVAALGLTVIGAGVATVGVLRAAPGRLLTGSTGVDRSRSASDD